MSFSFANARWVPMLVLALLVLSGRSAATRLEDDTFGGAGLDGCRWDDWSTAGGRVAANGALTLTTSATSAPSLATVYSQYRLRGDFTYSVSLSASGAWSDTVPPTDRVLAYLGFYVEDGTRFFIALAKNGNQRQIVVFSQNNGSGGDLVQIPVAVSGLRLQIVRIANLLTFQFDAGSGWQTAASVANVGRDGLVSIGANNSGTPRELVAAFSNFALTSGASTYRPYVARTVTPRTDFHAGVTVADYLAKRVWGPHYAVVDPLTPLAANGVGWVRAGVTTTSEPSLGTTPVELWSTLPLTGGDYQRNSEPAWWSSREYTAQILREAAVRGMRLDVFLFLSDREASAGVQNAPGAWRGLSVADTAVKVRESAFDTAKYFASQGLNVEVYEIGNEIDFGILNFLANDRIALPPGVYFDVTYMTQQVWPTEAILLKAAIAGIRAAQPNAKILLHIAGLEYSPANIMAKGFFKAMIDNGVEFDYAGLSLPYPGFPWRLDKYGAACWFQKLQETVDHIAELGKPTVLTEITYFAHADPNASAPIPEFPYTPQGQAAWLRETLRFAATNPNVAGVNYFYPDILPVPTGPGLFALDDTPLPAVAEFSLLAQALSGPQTPNYQGMWWNSPPGSESGWGINFAHQGDTIFATWFTFGLDGKPLWLVAGAPKTAPNVYSGKLYTGTGPAFNADPFDPAKVVPTEVGTATFSFIDGNNAAFSYTVNGIFQTKQITREVFASPVPSCVSGGQPNLALAANFQDIWWNAPAASESGWGINFAHQGDTIFATWFTFGLDGKPLWLVAGAPKTAPNVYSGTLYTGTGPAFNAMPFDPAKVIPTEVGTATFSFIDGNNATFSYSVNGIAQAKQITREIFSAPVTICH